MRLVAYLFHVLINLGLLLILSFPPVSYAEAPDLQRIDEASGLTYEQLLKADIPKDLFWEYILPQREYLRNTCLKSLRGSSILCRKALS